MRPVNKGASPYSYISDYRDAEPYLEARLGPYCSYCGFPLQHVPEVEHVISKSKNEALKTSWSNLLLGCKYCNTRKANTVDSENVGDYLWPDKYNTAIAFTYQYGVPKVNEDALLQADSTGQALNKARNIFDLVKLNARKDRRESKRNEAYQEALLALKRWQNTRNDDMKEQIISTARCWGFFSIWAFVFADESEMLNGLIDAFPGTEKGFFDKDGKPEAILQLQSVSETNKDC